MGGNLVSYLSVCCVSRRLESKLCRERVPQRENHHDRHSPSLKMSSALARAVNEKKSTRILRRDERKPVDESVASSGINRAGTKEVTKNPTRVVPELPGFHQLTKLEVTRDTRDIDKRSMLMVSTVVLHI